ncbi:hypothetical protein E2C01_025409 [Portunus trituberculatus]|uniref:Uncharacterized protein n=1 Tax=Portunus trituberculatus TaxID=210409 RepID=A0A5B7EHV1_PORTR|nr:hypothetical protein [Portunus trituberculatus]
MSPPLLQSNEVLYCFTSRNSHLAISPLHIFMPYYSQETFILVLNKLTPGTQDVHMVVIVISFVIYK